MDDFLYHYETRIKKKWTITNSTTIIDWISTTNLNILLIDTYLKYLRKILQRSTLWSLLISTITSTASITQFTITDNDNPFLTTAIKSLVFSTSLITSLLTGYIKIEKIQEKIESLEELKNILLKFMYSLLSELQVGILFRKNADDLINSKKEEFNSINSKQFEIPNTIRSQVTKFLMTNSRKTTIEDITKNYGCCKRNEKFNYIKKQLSLYHSVSKELEKELVEITHFFSDKIKKIEINTHYDLFNYKIIYFDSNIITSKNTLDISDDENTPNHRKKHYSKKTIMSSNILKEKQQNIKNSIIQSQTYTPTYINPSNIIIDIYDNIFFIIKDFFEAKFKNNNTPDEDIQNIINKFHSYNDHKSQFIQSNNIDSITFYNNTQLSELIKQKFYIIDNIDLNDYSLIQSSISQINDINDQINILNKNVTIDLPISIESS